MNRVYISYKHEIKIDDKVIGRPENKGMVLKNSLNKICKMKNLLL